MIMGESLVLRVRDTTLESFQIIEKHFSVRKTFISEGISRGLYFVLILLRFELVDPN